MKGLQSFFKTEDFIKSSSNSLILLIIKQVLENITLKPCDFVITNRIMLTHRLK